MIHKEIDCQNEKPILYVTFTIPGSIWADTIHLVGDFNDWNQSSHPLAHTREEKWSITVPLEPSKAYQFRYLINGNRWINDDNADAYVRSFTGSDNFLVITDPNFKKYNDK